FRDLLAAEWIKLRSLRSTGWTVSLTAVFVVGAAAVAALADYRNLAGTSTQVPRGFLPFDAFPPVGNVTLMIVAGSIGALTVAGEYGSGLICTTTVAVPARGSVVLAKAAVTATLWTLVGTATSTASFLVSQAILNGRHAGVPITHPGVFQALAASALLAPVSALIGLGLAALIRHSAATMVTVACTLLMSTLFSQGARWSADVNHAMVFSAWQCLVRNWRPSPDYHGYAATVQGSWIVYTLWPIAALVAAVATVRHRDT
ncbi:MAG: type transport system permease protein, partial [Cryptosporangiaceae bacterium]|nr:type transport system permease protein [Cryptosporangiaceae bacterium]